MTHTMGRFTAKVLVEWLERRQLLAGTIYVDLNAPGPTHDGTSWDSAYTDLQQALAGAASGDNLRVADATYTAGPNFNDTFQLKTGVAIRGGYAGYGAPDPNARDVDAFPTVLTARTSGPDLAVVNTTGADATTLIDGLTIMANRFSGVGMRNNGGSPTINDCTFTVGGGIFNANASPSITNCTFTLLEGEYASGVYNWTSSPTIANCTFYRCHGITGGAIANYQGSSAIISRCTFIGNQAGHEGQTVYNRSSTAIFIGCEFSRNGQASEEGGAIYNVYSSSLTLTRCTFTDNTSGGALGGAIFTQASSLTASECTFTRNHGGYRGGAICAMSSPMALTNCVFQGNTAGFGAAIDTSSLSSLTLTNCLFSGNQSYRGGTLSIASATLTNCTFSGNGASENGGAILLQGGTLSIRNSILWGDSAAIDGNEIYIAPYGSSTVNFDHSIVMGVGADPAFVRAPSPGADGRFGTADDDYGDLRLRSYSPGIDAGNNAAVPAGITTDLAGNPRFVAVRGSSAIVDIGAYEYQPPLTYRVKFFALTRDANHDQILAIADLGISNPFRDVA